MKGKEHRVLVKTQSRHVDSDPRDTGPPLLRHSAKKRHYSQNDDGKNTGGPGEMKMEDGTRDGEPDFARKGFPKGPVDRKYDQSEGKKPVTGKNHSNLV